MTQSEKTLQDALNQEGVLIKLRITMPRFSKGLSAEDLGLDPETIPDDLISLGRKKLLKKEVISSFSLLEGQAHQAVEVSSFPFMGGMGRFMPNAKLPDILERLVELKSKFQNASSEFVTNYTEHRDKAMQEWADFADSIGLEDKDRLLAEVSRGFPSADKVQGKFKFEWHLFHVKVPEELHIELTDAANADAIQKARQDAAEAARAAISERLQDFVIEAVAFGRSELSDLCSEMVDSMEGGKMGVHQKTLNRLVNFIDHFKQINFAGDKTLEAELDGFKEKFLQKKADKYRDDEFALAALKGGIKRLGKKAKELAEADSKALKEEFCGTYGRIVEADDE